MSKRLIGLEYEFLAIERDSGLAITRDIVKAIWRDFANEPNVTLYVDPGTRQPVGVWYEQPDGQQVLINNDAGVCIIEFGFLPYPTLQECYDNMRMIMRDFLHIAERHGVALLSYGIQPKTPHFFPDLKSEKIWYRGFGRFEHFARGHHMFHNIAAHQPCIDVSYDELLPVLNAFNALGGVFIALFANSAVGEFHEQCCHEEREHRWNKWVDGFPETQKIAGIPLKPFQHFQEYLEYNWSITLPAVHQNKTLYVIDPAPTIGEYLRQGKWTAFDVGKQLPSEVESTIGDVNQLNQYLWIQARPKYFFDETLPLHTLFDAVDREGVDAFAREHLTKLYIETRNIACQPWESAMAAPAFLLGLIEEIHEVEKIVTEKSWEYWRNLREETIKKSMEVEEAVQYAKRLVELAQQGLQKRGLGEEVFLTPLIDRIERRESPAMMATRIFEKEGIEGLIMQSIIRVE